MVRFLERNGYDVTYTPGVDTDRCGHLLTNHKDVPVGRPRRVLDAAAARQRQAARDAGVNLMFLSGNEMYWRARLRASNDGSHTPYRTLVCYKETWADDTAPRSTPSPEWTGDLPGPAVRGTGTGAGLPENALTGTIFMANHTELPVTVNAARGQAAGSGATPALASLPPGTSRALAPHTVGYESDEDLDNGFRPAGPDPAVDDHRGRPASTCSDFGNTVAPGHHHPPPDAVPRRQRRAGVRRRHDPVDLGPGRRRTTARSARRRRPAMQQARSTCWPTWAPSRRP